MNRIYRLKAIETPRLIIRPVQLGDEYPLNKSINNSLKSLQKWLPWAKDSSIAATRNFVQRGAFVLSFGLAIDFPMVIIHKKDQKIIAVTGFNSFSNVNMGIYEIGYWCDIDYQGMGYVTEYTNILTRYAFNELGALKVVLAIHTVNKKSMAVAKRLNFTLDGIQDRLSLGTILGKEYYIYALRNIDNLPDIKYSYLEGDNNLECKKIVSWMKNTLNITDKELLNSKLIIKTPWSNIIEITTGYKKLYLKQTPKMFAIEPKIIEFFSSKLKARVPKIIAENTCLNCFIMDSAGNNLRSILKQNFSKELILTTVEQFSDMQSNSIVHTNALQAMGVPNYSLNQLPKLYATLIQEESLLVHEGFTSLEIDKLKMLLSIVVDLCQNLASYNIPQTVVQLDFSDNNTLVNDSGNIVIIDLGEIVISHPFFSLINFLWQLEKHYQISRKSPLYQKVKSSYFKNYKSNFKNRTDFNKAISLSEKLTILLNTVYQLKFMKACGMENLIKSNHWKLRYLLEKFISKVQ